jgi:glutaredoxin 3
MSINSKNFVVYTKKGCPYCEKIKTVLSGKGAKYTEYVLGEHFTREQFYSEFGDATTFPQVICGDLKLGGCTESVQYFRAMGWV